MRINRKFWLCAVLGFALLLAGCGKSELASLYDGDVTAYKHPESGAAFMVPQSWEKLDEAAKSVIFATPDRSLSLTVYLELGGFSYYSDDELLDMGRELCGELLVEPEILRAGGRSDMGGQLVTAAGTLSGGGLEDGDKDSDKEGASAVCEVLVASPLPAVRYYLVTVCSTEAYEANSRLLEEVYLSFYNYKSEDELYAGLAEDAGVDDDIDNDNDNDNDE